MNERLPKTQEMDSSMNPWRDAIGELILNFGIIEWGTVVWIRQLGGVGALRKTFKCGLGERIGEVDKLIASSPLLSAEDQDRARRLWAEVRKHSKTRNRVAHNPLALGTKKGTGEPALSLLDRDKMDPDNPFNTEIIDASMINSVSLRVMEIERELSVILNSIP